MEPKKKINWRLIFADLRMEATRLAFHDPSCREEIRPIHDEIMKTLDLLRDQEDTIRQRYVDKYYEQLCQKRLNEIELINSYILERLEEKHE